MQETLQESFRLSPQQRHVCALQPSDSAAPFPYRTYALVRLEGSLEIDRLRLAVNQVIARHEILRTSLTHLPGLSLPMQVISPTPQFAFSLRDLSTYSPQERETVLRQLLEQPANAPLPSTADPIVEVTLLREQYDVHLLLLSLPVVNADTISCQLLLRELSQYYGHMVVSEDDPMQYADLAEWQYELLTSEETATERAYWRTRDQQNVAQVSLPFEQELSSSASFTPASHQLALPADKREAFDELARQWQVSTPALLLACWAYVLTYLTEQSDVLIGTSFSGRSYDELTEALGLFAKYLPLSYCVTVQTKPIDLAQQIEAQLLEAGKWQEYFSWDIWQPELSAQESFCSFGFEFARLPDPWQIGSLRFTFLTQHQVLDRFAVQLSCLQREQDLQLILLYDHNSFSSVQMRHLLQNYYHVLEQLLTTPQCPFYQLTLLTRDEEQWLQNWNSTQQELAGSLSLLQLFEQQVVRTPGALALRVDDMELSYQDLDRLSNRLAHFLRQKYGVSEEVHVAICMPPSTLQIVAVLAVLKAGGAYLPLDPATPSERLAFMLHDADVALLLTQESLREQLVSLAVIQLSLDQEWERIILFPPETPALVALPEQLAYILYTSGSTGTPKGVMVTQRGLLNYVLWASNFYQVAEGQGTLLHSPLTFDLTITSLFPPLLAGRPITLVPPLLAGQGLSTSLQSRESLSLLKVTPTHLEVLRQSVPTSQLAGRSRVLIVGGEALQSEHLTAWQRHAPQTRLINEYGPTETVVGCAVFEVPDGWCKAGAVPIGRPIANTRLYVLDAWGQQVPPGMAGELFIGGEGVARGYLGRPDLTAERFVPDPFSARPGARLYRSGDRVRMNPDGHLVFLGRLDQQVKIRGYRIELEEIEAHLQRHPLVREAGVVARSQPSEEPRLVAYLVVEQAGELTVEALRTFLQQQLPEYMVPSAYVLLEQMPVTRHGKVDRQALPAPDEGEMQQGVGYVAPRREEEEVLVGIWSQVLGKSQIGIDDNYFALGGDSIRSIEVITRGQERGLHLSVDLLFRFPTIRGLAEAVQQQHEGQNEAEGGKIAPFALLSASDRERMPQDVEDAYPLTMLQGGMLFHNEFSPGEGVYHDIFSYHARLTIDLTALREAARALVARHEVLRTAFDLTSYSEPLQLVYRQGPEILSIEDLQSLSAEQQEQAIGAWISQEKARGFLWSHPPLLRIHIQQRSENTLQFTLSFHHAIIDGWSDATLLTELFTHYFALLNGHALDLPIPAAHYRDFVALERAAVASATCQAYWDKELQGGSFTSIPRWPQPKGGVEKGVHVVPVPLSEEVSQGLKDLALATAVPIKNVLLAAHVRVLSLLSGQQDVTTCMVSGGRPEGKDGERVLGLFINSIPFRQQVAGGSWRELVMQTFAKEREALPYRRYPMAELKRRHGGLRLSETLFYFTHYHIFRGLQERGDIEVLELIPHEVSSFPLVANFWIDPFNSSVNLSLTCDGTQFSQEQVQLIANYYATALTAMATSSQEHYEIANLLSEQEYTRLLQEWNATDARKEESCIHDLIALQATRTPTATAVVYRDRQISYRELDEQANQLAYVLQRHGVGPEVRVGVYMDRSLEMIIGLLSILKAGGAYVPLDPSYPLERLAFMLQDAAIPLLLTQEHLLESLPSTTIQSLCLDRDWMSIVQESIVVPDSGTTGENTAYVIYTSGSTGTPKGVVVEHRNVTNFFSGMDSRIGDNASGAWLAVTSISFDISVLELFWTLSRGFKVVLQEEQDLSKQHSTNAAVTRIHKTIDFSLFYFASDEDDKAADKYRLLLDGARFADEHGFAAVWTPERHFHAFGGLYPNPVVTGAAIATITRHIQIRAGSVVLPLHNPIRVAEEWAVVDNLSHGRVGLSFASGWHANDFLLAPGNYAKRKEIMLRSIETVQRLWRNEAVTFTDDDGLACAIQIRPRPVQEELPIWLTAAGNPATFKAAGEMGVRLLTHLLGQDIEELAKKITLYRTAWSAAGHPADKAHVTLMLHTFIGESVDEVREKVRRPFCNYLRNSLDLVKDLAKNLGYTGDPSTFTEDDIEVLLSHAFERYFETSGLFGTAETCQALLEKLKSIGVDEVACLIDFGIDTDSVLASLHHLNAAKNRSNSFSADEPKDYSIAEQIVRHNISHMQCTPSLGRILAADDHTLTALQGLKRLLLGGEALPPALASQLLDTLPAEIYNMYGPTETTIWSTMYPIDRLEKTVAIGRPIANTQIYILDDHLQPVPTGTSGELYIGGAGVVRGYLNRPDITAERFVADPFAAIPGSRLYRTGDIARYLLDGTIEFLGRSDQQVKIRGHRIELGEIEAVLEQLPQVSKSAVTTYSQSQRIEEQHLVAYLVLEPKDSISRDEIRSFLRQKLPDYMQPTSIMLLDALPLTPNRKVDRHALPLPDTSQPGMLGTYVAPHTPMEEILTNIWSEILGVEKVGIHDTFFELGGYSLQATQLISRLRTLFQVNLPLRSFFETPTIAALSTQVELALQFKQDEPEIPLVPVSQEGLLPLSFAQMGIWFLAQLAPKTSSYNEPAGVHLKGMLVVDVLERALHAIGQRHAALRSSFTILDGQPMHTIQAEVKLPLTFIDLRDTDKDMREEEALHRATQEIQKPFDLSTAPLLRVTLIRLAEDEYILLLVTHHIISDGWSMGIFVRELASLYDAFLHDVPQSLPDLPIQYSDFAVWQRQLLQGELLERQLAYWKTQLQAPLPIMKLPVDYPLPEVRTFQGATRFFRLPEFLFAGLRGIGRKEGVTLFMTLITAFKALLHYYSGQDDLVIGTDIANRSRTETEGLIGLFVNQLVLRSNFGGNPSFREALQRVREVTLGAFAHQDLPFDRLVEALNPERDLRRTPLFQVKFVLQSAPAPIEALADVVMKPVEVERGTSKFDLLLNLSENGQSLFGWLEYNTDIFEPDTMTRLLNHFELVLNQIVANPDIHLDALESTLAAAEQEERRMHEEQLQQIGLQKLGATRRKKR